MSIGLRFVQVRNLTSYTFVVLLDLLLIRYTFTALRPSDTLFIFCTLQSRVVTNLVSLSFLLKSPDYHMGSFTKAFRKVNRYSVPTNHQESYSKAFTSYRKPTHWIG